MDNRRRRVVVTGLGVVSPVGLGAAAFWQALVSGRSGIAPISKFDPEGLRTSIAAEVRGFDPHDHADGRTLRTNDPSAIYLLAAAREALIDAGLERPPDPATIGVVVGLDAAQQSIARAALSLEQKGPLGVDAYAVIQGMPNSAGALVAQQFGLRGAQFAVAAACASGATSLLTAWNLLQLGFVDAVVAGSTTTLDRFIMSGFAAARVLSPTTDPATACRPFDRLRDGFVLGEGSAAVVVEDLGHAEQRGANIYAELLGGWQSSSIVGWTVNPAADCAACMEAALRVSRIQPDEVELVGAHATSTQVGDSQEAEALQLVFGDRRVPAFAAKSMLGHCMSAGGGLETVAAILALRHAIAPPTINYRNPDPRCAVDCIPNEARPLAARVVLKNSFGFGGANCCLVLRRYQ
jgi:3-oxoacyl-[acyl-carrier-protein] synthase II